MTSCDLLAAAIAALGGEPRDGQQRMAEEVERALENDAHALIQAGTGTGKSLAYLVPAVSYAVRHECRIVVSTATLALQRQIFMKDLPLVIDALEPKLGQRARAALFKGRVNYLCAHKMGGGYPEPEEETLPVQLGPTSDLGHDVARLHEWAEETVTGDRDDLIPGVSHRAWSQVSVTGRECLESTCPSLQGCFSQRARDEAARAHVVVTNHAVLGVQAASHDMIGDHDVLIVDEAHELVSRITSAATHELTPGRIGIAARRARRCGVDLGDLDDAGRRLDDALLHAEIGRVVGDLPELLQAPIDEARAAARAGISAVAKTSDADGAAAKVATAALNEVFAVCEELLSQSGDTVVWVAPADGEYDSGVAARVLAAPLDVGGLIATNLIAGRASVMTSATLALGGNFDAAARILGVNEPQTLDAGSPFDYSKQGILYVAAHLPRPGPGGISDEALEEMAELIAAAGGRTLGLFSSHRAARMAVDEMRERFDFPILYQKDDQLSTLVSQFREDEETCLFGSTALWQGIDIPGRTAALVIIDRIPFPRPDDPITEARTEAAENSGGNGFMDVSVAHAALLLAQGAGRLIRSTEDRGVVAVLDSRLAHARYGSYLAKSVPPMWSTTDRGTVFAALGRLHAS